MTTSNATQNYLEFKNDILKDIREFEKRICDDMRVKNNKIDSNMFDFQNKIDKLEKESKNSSLNIIEIKTQLNRFNEYFNFKQKIENMVFNHDIRLKISVEEIDRIKTKYDKLIDQNLIIPGILGGSSKFKNLKDYIHNNNNEIARIKYALEEEKKLSLEFKKKFETIPKTMINMVDSAVKRSNDYVDLKQKEIEKLIETKMMEYNEKLMDLKVEIFENKKIFEEKLKYEMNINSNLKNELLEIINENITKITDLNQQKTDNYENIKLELEEFKKNRNKMDNQVLNNTQTINELKYKIKSLNMNTIRYNANNNNFNYNYNYNNNPKNRIDNIPNNNNNDNNSNNNQSRITLSAKRKKNELNINNRNNINSRNITSKKLSYRGKININKIKDFGNSETKNNNLNKENEKTENKPSNETGVKTNIKRYSNEQFINNNLTLKEGLQNKSMTKNSEVDSSSLDEEKSEAQKETDKKVSRLSFKGNKEIEKYILDSNKKNNIPISIDEDKCNLNKIFINEEKDNELNTLNDKKDFESAIFKSKINKIIEKNVVKNSKKNLKEKISIEAKAQSFYTNNKSLFYEDRNIPNIMKYSDSTNALNKKKINIKNKLNNTNNNINDNYQNEKENNLIIINSKENINKNYKIEPKKKTKNNKVIDINNKNNNINNNIKNNDNINIKRNTINIIYNNSEKSQNNDNFPINSKLNVNLGIIDSFLNSNNNKKKKYLKSIENYTSRNDFRKNFENQSSDTDLKVNNIDLFAKTRKTINDKNNLNNYSLNGKKIKSKKKEKQDEEEISPLDNLYKSYFNKNHKNESLSQEQKINNLKRIKPAFGRTAYTFYEKKETREFGSSLYNNNIL